MLCPTPLVKLEHAYPERKKKHAYPERNNLVRLIKEVSLHLYLCVCVIEREREREKEKKAARVPVEKAETFR